ncbi:hypothetical protein ACFWF9_01685 [Streptomyces roseolus]|uniref:hypothetical protein n=1 Tax=Streptomyces TaxID=1883 RepID=UPI0033B4D231
MNRDIQGELIPRGDTLRLIGSLDNLKTAFLDAADPLTDFGNPASWPTVTPARSPAPSTASPLPATPGVSRTAARR